ncbi:MAG: 30S ribosomal protein S5 [Sphingobacteriia bacterium]|nr:30S ribosomal protein S5 [Sphingobacteriia bacterium]
MSKVSVNKVKAGGDIELKDKVVAINRVVKTTKGGRTFSFSALVVVGNENGVVGQGLGKAKEVQEAIAKGIEDAKKNLVKVPIMHGTIPHEQWAKDGAAKVLIKPAAHGAGVIAGGSMRAVLESAGVTDVLAKSLGSANPHNVVKATIKALSLLREPVQVAKSRTIKLSKVFNG